MPPTPKLEKSNETTGNKTTGNAEQSEHLSCPLPRRMPKWEMNEDIVISGIAGRFPESDNLDEFAAHLYNNDDMVTADDRRWPTGM